MIKIMNQLIAPDCHGNITNLFTTMELFGARM